MNAGPHILIYGSAPDLLDTRRLVLEYAGFRVTISLSLEQTGTLLSSKRFDLLLLCHTLSRPDCEGALSQAHTVCPEMTNLILGPALSGCAGSKQDARLTAFAAPETLIATVRELTGAPNQRSTRTRDFHV